MRKFLLLCLMIFVVAKIDYESLIRINLDHIVEYISWRKIDSDKIEGYLKGENEKLAGIFKMNEEQWSETSEIKRYEGITRKRLVAFIEDFSKDIGLSQNGMKYLKNELIKQLLINDEDFFEGEIIFSVLNDDCKYVHFFIESNEENSFDFLAFEFKKTFALGEEIFWINSSVEGWNTIIDEEEETLKTVFGQKVISKEEISFLFEFFEYATGNKIKNTNIFE